MPTVPIARANLKSEICSAFDAHLDVKDARHAVEQVLYPDGPPGPAAEPEIAPVELGPADSALDRFTVVQVLGGGVKGMGERVAPYEFSPAELSQLIQAELDGKNRDTAVRALKQARDKALGE